MMRVLSMLFILARLLAPQMASFRLFAGMQSGYLLRCHVVAQDDTAEMQRVKLCVRDAVLDAYAAHGTPGAMLPQARALLPVLTRAAEDAAEAEGFSGKVRVCLERRAFEERMLEGVTVPAGNYPALMVYLGNAQGHNWWGLLDPDMACRCAGGEGISSPWDWSWQGFLDALRRIFSVE